MSGFTLRRRLHGPTDVKLMPRKASLAHKETYKERRQEILLTFRREGKLGVVIRLHTQFFTVSHHSNKHKLKNKHKEMKNKHKQKHKIKIKMRMEFQL